MTPELREQISGCVVPGWCSLEKAFHLADLILEFKPHMSVELGVFGGKSFFPMAFALRSIEIPSTPRYLVGIDSWSKGDCLEGEDENGQAVYFVTCNLETVRDNFLSAFKAYKKRGLIGFNVDPLDMRDAEAVGIFKDHTINLFHMDGNHSEKVSVETVARWLPKLAPGCVWIVDDIRWDSQKKALATIRGLCNTRFENKQWGVYILK